MFQQAISELKLPEGFEIIIEPWPYGGLDRTDENRRYFQGLVFAQDAKSKGEHSNFYAYPIPIIPVMDFHKREIIRIDRPATGGRGDSLIGQTAQKGIVDHCRAAEYVPELLGREARQGLKPLNVLQPEGASFQSNGSLVEWQKWRFRVGFNPREGATIHDVWYDGRSVMYRLGFSEMVCVPWYLTTLFSLGPVLG